MKPSSKKATDAPKTIEQLKLELKKCSSELGKYRKRLQETEALFAHEIAERRRSEEKLNQLNAELLQQAAALREANQTLLDSEQRLRIAVETGRIGLFVWDSTQLTNPGDWSNQLKEIFGLPLNAEVTHDMFLKCVHPDDRDHIDQCVQRALLGENNGEYETEYRTIKPADGSEHWVTARGQAFFNAEGKAIRFIGTVMDITERKQAEQSLSSLNGELEKRIAQRLTDLSRTNEALQNEITERKRMEDKLRQSQAYLAEAQKLSLTGSFGWNLSTGEIIWSKETYCIFEFDPEQKPALDLVFKRIHPEDAVIVQEMLDRATREEVNLDYEHRLLMSNGSVKHLHVVARPSRNKSGEVEYVGAVMDITAQKRLENQLRRSERNLAEGQRLTKTGSWILDFETGNTDWSVETCRIFGFPDPPPSPHYCEFRARVCPEDQEAVDRGLRESFETGEPRPLKYTFILPDGTRKNIETISQPVRDGEGKLKLMGTVMDVTERVKAQQALQQSEHYLRLVIDTIPGLVWSAKSDGYIEYLNKRWIDYTGLTLKQACGWGWREAIYPEDLPGLESYWRSMLAERKPGEIEARLKRYDGEFRWFLFRGFPLHDKSGKLVKWYGTNTDIDDHRRAEERVRRSEAHLTEAQGLSHTGSFSWKPSTGEVLWSAEMYRIFQYDPGVKPTLELARCRIHPDDFGLFEDKVRRGTHDGTDMKYGHRLLMPDGVVKFVDVVSRAFRNKSGEIEHVGAVMDVTDLKRAGEALRTAENLARGQLAAVTRTLDSLAKESDPDKLPEHVVTTILTQMGAHSATIWERNEGLLDLLGIVEEGKFQTSIEAGYFGGSIPAFKNAPPLWGEALSVGLHFVIEDISEEPARVILADGRTAIWPTAELPKVFADLKTHFIARGIRALLISPMMMAGQLAGIIGIRFTGTRVFGAEEIELTKALAQQATLAMQLMRLSRHSREAAVVAERNRMARDIHDTLAQGFTGVIMQLEAAKGATTQRDLAETANRINRASELARSSLGEARRSVRALRPRSLRDGKLFVALDGLLKRMTEGTELNAEFQADGDERFIPSDYEEDLLRITQEALTNAVKHSGARNFRATLSVAPNRVQLRLVDDGRGYDLDKEHDGFGLIGMKQRVDRMGGEFIIRTKPGVGTEVLVVLKTAGQLEVEGRK